MIRKFENFNNKIEVEEDINALLIDLRDIYFNIYLSWRDTELVIHIYKKPAFDTMEVIHRLLTVDEYLTSIYGGKVYYNINGLSITYLPPYCKTESITMTIKTTKQ